MSSHHFDDGSFPGDGFLQLQQTERELRRTATAVQGLPPRPQPGCDLTFQATETNTHD